MESGSKISVKECMAQSLHLTVVLALLGRLIATFAVRVLCSPSTHSLEMNSIGDEGAKALADAMKTKANLQALK